MKIQLPEKVNYIIERLQEHGHEAYAVGGCVRDSILGRTPEDWDITTSAMPQEVKQLFHRTFDTGIEHGTITVLLEKEGFEVTTYRIDGEYTDHRHPKQVAFTGNLREDLRRRDFTINAMAYNHQQGMVDIFGGCADLERGVIRCVGDPRERFGEDALRILRALRFAAQLGFAIDEETKKAVQELASHLNEISAERIQVELVKLLISPHPDKLREAYELGVTGVILPEFDRMMVTAQETPHHQYSVGEHTIVALGQVRATKVLRLTLLFHDIGKPLKKTVDEQQVAHFKGHAKVSEEITQAILRRLKFDNDTRHKVAKLVLYHDYRMPATARSVRRGIHRIGKELFPLYLEVRRADILAQSEYLRGEKLADIEQVTALYQEILSQEQCVCLKDLKLSGRDLIAAGMKQGSQIGEVLEKLLQEVLDDPDLNQKERLLKRAKELF